MQSFYSTLLVICLVYLAESCLPSGSSHSNHPKSIHDPCGPILDAVYECSYLNEVKCKFAIKTKTQISCGDSQGMFLKGDRDFFPVTRLICDEVTQLWMVDGGDKSVYEKVGDNVRVACYLPSRRVKTHNDLNWLVDMTFH